MSANYHFGQSTVEISDQQIQALASIPLTTIPYLAALDQNVNTVGTPEFQKLGINQIAGTNQLEVNGTSVSNFLVATSISTGSVSITGGINIENFNTTNITTGSLTVSNGANINNLIATSISAGSISISGGFGNINIKNLNSTNISTGSLIVQNGATITNISTTSVSSGSLIVSTGTITNLNSTSSTIGSLLVSTGSLTISGGSNSKLIVTNQTADNNQTLISSMYNPNMITWGSTVYTALGKDTSNYGSLVTTYFRDNIVSTSYGSTKLSGCPLALTIGGEGNVGIGNGQLPVSGIPLKVKGNIEATKFNLDNIVTPVEFGYGSGGSNADSGSTFIGHMAGNSVSTGFSNTIVGYEAAQYTGAGLVPLVGGHENVCLGMRSGVNAAGTNNALALGTAAVATTNGITIGNSQHVNATFNATGTTEFTGSIKVDGGVVVPTILTTSVSSGSLYVSGGTNLTNLLSTSISTGSLILSGGETCGSLLISSGSLTISGGNNTISLTNSNTIGTTVLSSLLAPNITVSNISSNMGKDTNAYGSIVDTYYADPTPANVKGSIGLYGRPTAIEFNGNANVGINNTPVVGQSLTVGGVLAANDTYLLSLNTTGTTTGSLYVYGGATIPNLSATSVSSGNLIVSTGTVTNLTATSITSGTMWVSGGLRATSITSGTMWISGGATIPNLSATSVSSGNLIVSTGTVTNLTATSITCGTLTFTGGSNLSSYLATSGAMSGFGSFNFTAPATFVKIGRLATITMGSVDFSITSPTIPYTADISGAYIPAIDKTTYPIYIKENGIWKLGTMSIKDSGGGSSTDIQFGNYSTSSPLPSNIGTGTASFMNFCVSYITKT